MNLFQFPRDEVVTSFAVEDLDRVRKVGRGLAGLSLTADSHQQFDLDDQFIAFQFNNELEGPSILESSQVVPKIEGQRDQPDVLVSLEMLSFNISANENIEPDTRATMRINFGKDESSTDKRFDTAFWSIAAGLDLYDQIKNQKADSKGFRTDFHKAFGNRPIEIPGGLGKLSFEVIKHREPPWWRRIFKFLEGDAGHSLISVLGFPAITYQAIDVLDELLNRLDDSEPEVLFKSLPMRLALSQYAHDEFTGGNPRVRLGSLRQGFCVLARGRDFDKVNESNVIYYPTYGKLVPQDISASELVTGNYEDPLKDVTYAVFRVGMKSTMIDPTFNYSA